MESYNISIIGVTEARLVGSNSNQSKEATFLYSGGSTKTNGVGLFYTATPKHNYHQMAGDF